MENEFEVDISQKVKIFTYIEKLRINYDFNESFFNREMQKLEEDLKLNEDIAKQLLKEMYEKGSSIRDNLHATENFKEKIDKAFKKFDNLPDFSQTSRYEYDIKSSEFTNIFSVLDELIEVDKEFYQVRDLMCISKYIIDTTKQIQNKEVSGELKEKLYPLKII